MNKTKDYAGIDWFRMAAAFLVVAIHTGPLEQVNQTADYLVTYCAGRIGVPFFFLVTGFFVLGKWTRGTIPKVQKHRLIRYLVRILILYTGITLLYFPIAIYAENLPKGIIGYVKWFCIDGTFYHLWYLPALLIGTLLTALLIHFCHPILAGCFVSFFYIVGVFGDSWYGLIGNTQVGEEIYYIIFRFSTYTRNGIFMAPIFLWMGAMLYQYREKQIQQHKETTSGVARYANWIGFAVSFLLMLMEGYITWKNGLQRHDSMYFFLLPVMWFLVQGLLDVRGMAPKALRSVSMWIYLLHPMSIILVRGSAKLVGLQNIIVENQIVFYLFVCIVSTVISFCVYGSVVFLKGIKQEGKDIKE